MDPRRWPQGGAGRRRIDTHISTVVLAGELAYKIKKPLDLGFLNFLSLESREHYCHEELRLNSRHAPQIYQAVCAVTGSIEAPRIDGEGEAIDWAVRMARFDPDAILSNLAERLDPALIERLAVRVAAFHAEAARCPEAEPFGTPDAVYAPMQQNFAQIRKQRPAALQTLQTLERWTAGQRERNATLLRERRAGGHIRECHGDLHLGNVALIDGEPVVFDAIEFNPGLRWIDTINDVAFLTMDLNHRERAGLAQRFLDRYLRENGDYAGLRLLRFYEVYRALVRAKIAAIRLGQELDAETVREVEHELSSYVDLAHALTHRHRGALVITQGVSGSGKSFVTGDLADLLPAVRLRSDVERKRLMGIDPGTDATGLGAYSAELTERTYGRLAELARSVAAAGFVAVVDATFLKRAQRARLRHVAQELEVPFVILDCDAPLDTLRERVLKRRGEADNVSDAGIAVLEGQLRDREPLNEEERALSIAVRPDRPLDAAALRQRVGW
jgi:aminoglycoside phosphotransferase family enzyme/predicted kinase